MMKITTLFTMLLVITAYFVSAQGLIVLPNTNVKVASGTTLDLTAGNLLIESDATGDASLVNPGSMNYKGGGEANAERYLTSGKWHLVTSPITGELLGMFEEDYLQYHTESTNACTDIIPVTYGLIPAKGYALWLMEAQISRLINSGLTYCFKGKKNSCFYN